MPSQKPRYKDSYTQTDEIKYAWWSGPRKKKGKIIMSLARRLLLNRSRKDLRKLPAGHDPLIHSADLSIAALATPHRALEMQVQELKLSSPDKSISPSSDTSTIIDVNIYNSLPQATNYPTLTNSPLAWSKSTNTKSETAHLDISPDTRAPFLIPLPSSNDSGKVDINSTTQLTILTPSPINSGNTKNFQQSLVNTQNPSPIRTTKKLSLSDYKAARMKKTDSSTQVPKTPIGEKSPESNHAVPKPPLMTVYELKSSIKPEESAKDDNPPKDKSSVSATT